MKQEPFERSHQADWERLAALLEAIEKAGMRRHKIDCDTSELPSLYRNTAHQLALARSRAYSPQLIERLSGLVSRGHQTLYGNRPGPWAALARFVGGDFPRLVRSEWRFIGVSAALFFGPMLAMAIAIAWYPQLVYTAMSPYQVSKMESMYEPDNSTRIGESRDSGSDIAMFGLYIRNNTGIGFQTFASGLLFGLGTLFFLLYNGVVIGSIAGHLTELGYIDTFWGFVAGHSGPELTAIVLSGAAGLRLGWALIAPGRLSRPAALRAAAAVAVKIIYGAMLLFLLAAFIEAFWSAMGGIPATAKYIVGALIWLLLLIWLVGAGRRHQA